MTAERIGWIGRNPEETPGVALRPLAIPNEHGGWGFLLEPIALGLAVAPSGAGALLGLAIVAAFFVRHPLRLAARDWMLGKQYPRTRVCALLALAYGSVSLASFLAAMAMTSATIVLPLVAVSPLLVTQFAFDVRNRGRELVPELCGAAAAATGGAACVLAAGGGAALSIVVAVLAVSRSVPAVLYVRALLRRKGVALEVLAHVCGALAVALLWRLGVAPLALLAVPLALLLRSLAVPFRTGVTARRIGVEEVLWGVFATVVAAALLRAGV